MLSYDYYAIRVKGKKFNIIKVGDNFIFYLLYAETESRGSDDVAIATIVIAVISLLTSVTAIVIMVCFVVLFMKRNSVTEGQKLYMDMKQNLAYATTAEKIPRQQDTIYECVDL